MTALFGVLTRALTTDFTAATQAGSPVLLNPSATTGLFLGLPVFGAGIARGAVIESLSPLTLSEPAAGNAAAAALTTGFLSTGRRVKFSRDVPQPALFMRDGDEESEYQGLMEVLTLRAEVWVCCNAGEDPDIAPIILLNNCLDAVRATLDPDDPTRQRFTLGGLVHWCRMLGKIEKEPGDLDGQAIAVADIEIIVP